LFLLRNHKRYERMKRNLLDTYHEVLDGTDKVRGTEDRHVVQSATNLIEDMTLRVLRLKAYSVLSEFRPKTNESKASIHRFLDDTRGMAPASLHEAWAWYGLLRTNQTTVDESADPSSLAAKLESVKLESVEEESVATNPSQFLSAFAGSTDSSKLRTLDCIFSPQGVNHGFSLLHEHHAVFDVHFCGGALLYRFATQSIRCLVFDYLAVN
jgi:hypothetical protein